MAVIGQGYSTDFGGLHLEVEWLNRISREVWHYRIVQPRGNDVLINWTPVDGSGLDGGLESGKRCAIVDALTQLKRDGEDADAVFGATKWQPYGPGHNKAR